MSKKLIKEIFEAQEEFENDSNNFFAHMVGYSYINLCNKMNREKNEDELQKILSGDITKKQFKKILENEF